MNSMLGLLAQGVNIDTVDELGCQETYPDVL
jgi:hypothetical protein